jgi:signal transduction histidine kinase
MAATLAHEMKTPLATISNLLQVLPERLDDRTFTSRFIVLTKEELSRTYQLINNLLAYGKEIDASHVEWFPLAPLCSELAVKNSLRVDAPASWDVHGDRFYLGLLFDNLMRNSRAAGADRIRVTVRMDQAEDNERVAILFEDNGSGFPADADLTSLFTPFVTYRSSGAGLGLYLVGKIVTAHDGIISLYRPEQGAGVRISLPRNRVRTNERV